MLLKVTKSYYRLISLLSYSLTVYRGCSFEEYLVKKFTHAPNISPVFMELLHLFFLAPVFLYILFILLDSVHLFILISLLLYPTLLHLLPLFLHHLLLLLVAFFSSERFTTRYRWPLARPGPWCTPCPGHARTLGRKYWPRTAEDAPVLQMDFVCLVLLK